MFDSTYEKRNFPAIRPGWLALRDETVIDPGLEIVDAHHHLWRLSNSAYLRDDLLADTRTGHRVRATVYVECKANYRVDGPLAMRPVGETEFAIAQSATVVDEAITPCAAIVGWADLTLGDAVQSTLEAHIEAGRGRFRGLRLRAAWHEDAAVHPPTEGRGGLLLDPSIRRGLKWLTAANLSLDIWAFHTQLGEVGRLASLCPDTPMILGHCGGPLGIGPFAGRRHEVFRTWRASIVELAQHENIVVKLGGLGMPRIGFDFTTSPRPPSSEDLADAWRPYIETCIDAFGAKRCMFESNFPVDKGACSYPVIWNAFKRIAVDCSPDERAALFGRTAATVYRIAC